MYITERLDICIEVFPFFRFFVVLFRLLVAPLMNLIKADLLPKQRYFLILFMIYNVRCGMSICVADFFVYS